jgi:hypothetical protein
LRNLEGSGRVGHLCGGEDSSGRDKKLLLMKPQERRTGYLNVKRRRIDLWKSGNVNKPTEGQMGNPPLL